MITNITVANIVMSRRPDGMFAQGVGRLERVQNSLQALQFHAKKPGCRNDSEGKSNGYIRRS